jgi:NADH:ubiquinone oxidoreductase subunit K
MHTLTPYLLLSAGLFCTGLIGVMLRRNAIILLASIELMLNAANINFVAFWRFHPSSEDVSGLVMVLFTIAIAAAEAAVGLALVISIYRHYRTTNPDTLNELKG